MTGTVDIPDYMESETDIQKFYSGASVLITGGTGFVGKLLVSKILICCPNVRQIYLIVRPKVGVSVADRATYLFGHQVFDQMRKFVPNFKQKITVVAGNCDTEDLGLSESDRNELINEVNVVIHTAATVKFNEPLNTAIRVNVIGAKAILTLAQQMKDLKSLVHISTAYSNCHKKVIEERFYDVYDGYEHLIELAKSKDKLHFDDVVTRKMIGERPNTYVFSKAVAEDVILNEFSGMPVAIFRPSIILSPWKEPLPGWIDNLYGPTGIAAGGMTGILKIIPCNKKCVCDLVPADMVVNAIIAVSYETYRRFSSPRRLADNPAPSPPTIYNFVSSTKQPLTWDRFITAIVDETSNIGLETAISYPAVWCHSNYLIYKLLVFFFHVIPAIIIDFTINAGKKFSLRIQYEKVETLVDTLFFFSTREWKMRDGNVENCWKNLSKADKRLFNFNIRQLNWDDYLAIYTRGIKQFVLKENMESSKGKNNIDRLYTVHIILRYVSYAFMLGMIYLLVTRVFTSS